MQKQFRANTMLCLTILYSATLWGQKTSITGTVTNSITGEKVPAVSVTIKGSNTGTYTNGQGVFQLSAPTVAEALVFSSIGYLPQEFKITDLRNNMEVRLVPTATQGEAVVVSATRTPMRILESPVSIEHIGPKQIINSPTASYYDLALSLKGVDVTTSSLTFKTISTRGFNGSGSYRVNQIVDGMDNQAPGLNFFVGNFVGLTELDVDNMELLPGASSALYGPGGMNGTVLINSKSPFKYQGLSVLVKQGITHVDKRQRSNVSPYYDYTFRFAKAFNNKFAFKLSGQYIKTDDWLAGDTTNYQRSGSFGKTIPGNRMTDPNYDGVNVYGDETKVDIRPFMQGAISQNPALQPILSQFLTNAQNVSRTGYHEIDVIDPETKNIKLSGALHYKLNNNLEAQLMGYWGTGNTIYTGNNRYVLRDIKIGQYKLELKHKNWFVRGYTTQENAGEAHTATVSSQILNENWKRSYDPSNVAGSWYPQYTGAFITGAAGVFQQAFAAAKAQGKSDAEAIAFGQSAVGNAAPEFHKAARTFADKGRLMPGTADFKEVFDQVRKVPIPNGGLFVEKSQLWMAEGQYNFSEKIKFAEIIIGGNYKKYILDSEGTLFIDTLNPIGITEIGAYIQATKKLLNDRLSLSVSGRYDKNEDFKGHFTPRATALIKLAQDHNLRLSYQTAYRFPGTQQKYIRLNVGDYTLLGGLPWVMDYMGHDKSPVVELINNIPSTTPYVYKEFKPESVQSFEIGYKGLINKKILIDAYGYWGKYQNFLGRNVLLQPSNGAVYSTVVNSETKVKTYGYGLGIDYMLPSNYAVFLNAYSDVITDIPAGFQAFFNTPKYRLNAGFSNSGLGKSKNFGFNVMLRWQDAFIWDGELANGPVESYTTVDAQVSYKIKKAKTMVKVGGTNIFNSYYKNAYGNPEIGGLYYVSVGYNLF
ncbi:MAG TPA: TonB-dependent receptor [Flavitalea sp.]|nr:TonB-dependent receptor [Flavitalea sp.]